MLKHPLLTGAAMIALVAALVFSVSKAHADPPPKGTYTALPYPVIVCDTEEQVTSIARAGENDGTKMVQLLIELAKTTDAKGEPTCVQSDIGAVAFGESTFIGNSHTDNGTPVHAWAVHFGNEKGDWWLLYAEEIGLKNGDI